MSERTTEELVESLSAIADTLHNNSYEHPLCAKLDVLEAARRLEHLQSVVDRLPKCWRLNEEGELVRDVPVTPGMNLYTFDGIDASIVVGCGVASIQSPEYPEGECALVVRCGDGDEWTVAPDYCYSTEPAARAAAESAKEGESNGE